MIKDLSKQDRERLEELLVKTVKHFNDEDRYVREKQLRCYRRLKLYWNNFSQIYWSEAARDYRIYQGDAFGYGDETGDQDYYDRPINVFRAFLETIIAALSIQIPGVSCAPDDADNPNDIATAKAGDQIAELLYKHNDVIFLWLYALYVHMTEGMVACYTYPKEDKKYGTYEEKKYKDEEVEGYICPNCKNRIEDDLMEAMKEKFSNPIELQNPELQNPELQTPESFQPLPPDEELSFDEENEFSPDNDDIELHDILEEEGPVCPLCAADLDVDLQKSKLVVPRFIGTTTKPKSRICLEIFGGLYVKIANYAKTQEGTLYLIKSMETHYAKALECYPDMWEKLPKGSFQNVGINDPYETYARLNPQYRNAFPEEQVTIKESWLRPDAFNIHVKEDAMWMKKHLPDGAFVAMVNDICVDFDNEALDDCWTITRNPMHDYLNHDPAGELLTNIQDITNDLISLTLQTIEHGIEQVWADPSVVNFDAQQQIEANPGTITPTKLQGGQTNISQAFFTTKAATLAPEVFQFYEIINQLGQFVSAAMPSIFGGSQESGSSRTAAEYSMSRSASLQRLQTTWKMFTIWWKNIFGKAIPAYIKLIKEDEKYVQKDDNGNYVNVWIRRAELSGKIGDVELEGADQIPISDEQKADIVMRLFELNNQEIIAALASPENLPFIRKIVKIPEFRLPGEDDRTNEYEIIGELVNQEPIVTPPDPLQIQMAMAQGIEAQPIEEPSIPVDPDVDDSNIGAEIDRGWLVSEAGRLAKVEKPNGYKNVLLRLKQHKMIVAQQQMQMMQQQAVMNQSSDQDTSQKENKPPTPKKSEKQGANNVGTSSIQ